MRFLRFFRFLRCLPLVILGLAASLLVTPTQADPAAQQDQSSAVTTVAPASPDSPSANLVNNGDFEDQSDDKPADFTITGNVDFHHLADSGHGGPWCVGFATGKDVGGGGLRQGSIAQTVTGIDARAGRWFRFSIRGLPQENFSLDGDDLDLKLEYFAGESGYDGKVKHLYSIIEQQRKDLSINGDRHVAGAAAWHTYELDVMLPTPQIDRVRLTISFDHGNSGSARACEFLVTGVSFHRIEGPAPTDVADPHASEKRPDNLIPIGGRWFYKADGGETAIPKRFDAANADRLIYYDNVWSAPFEGSMTAWLRAGDEDLQGNIVTKDRFVADNVVVSFDSTSMIIHTHGLPNHPTGKFPGENPNRIREQDHTYYIPLDPKENPNHVVTTKNNSNHALPMGPIGIAVNGVVFFNPFDAGSQDASNIMDYCCGHPNQDGLYHYHKYPICINSPWADEGTMHSPLIGWAFDGFPIYGPYVKAGLLAKDATGADALNDFNLHTDSQRGPHYQVTPGKFPYIIGGYWGTPDPRDLHGGRGMGPMGGRGPMNGRGRGPGGGFGGGPGGNSPPPDLGNRTGAVPN